MGKETLQANWSRLARMGRFQEDNRLGKSNLRRTTQDREERESAEREITACRADERQEITHRLAANS